MCGILGILDTNQNIDLSKTLKIMSDCLIHRGPDDYGQWHDAFQQDANKNSTYQVGLAQRRLSIIDTSGGHQPIQCENNRFVLIANGEIYNSPKIREKFKNNGYQFRTHTDVEVILPLYISYGKECVHHLRGMFAFAIWDKVENSLFLARDHLGQKPLFYALNDQQSFMFSSEIKSILASRLIERDVDIEALWHYMSMRFIPDDMTLFKNVKKLPAAHYLFWKDNEIDVQAYWSLDFSNKHQAPENEIISGLDDILNKTVQSHLLSDVEVGAFLSGGIDSSLVTSIMAKHMQSKDQAHPLSVFSIGVEEQSYNELPFARQVAELYAMNIHEQVVKADVINLIPKMIHNMDEPADPFGMGIYLVSELAKSHVKVVLTGDGGDESFAGYDRYIGQKLVDYYAWLPGPLRKHIMTPLFNVIPDNFGYKTPAKKLRWLNEMSFYTSGDRYARSMSTLRFTHEDKMQLFSESAQNDIFVKDSHEKVLKFFKLDKPSDLVDKMLYTDMMTRLPDHLLVLADRMTMAHSIESRAPFVDVELVEYAAKIPANLKLKNRTLKYPLKKVAEKYLPNDLIHRKKQGFGFPIASWIRDELRDLLRNMVEDSIFVQMRLFNKSVMRDMVEQHLSGKVDHNFRLWILLNLEIWYRMYIEEMPIHELNEKIAVWQNH